MKFSRPNALRVTRGLHRGQGAFTIVEVVVAVLVLATITGALYAALSSSFAVLQTTREDLRATQILMQRIEAVRLCTWSELSSFSFQESYDPLAVTAQGTTYFGNLTIGPATDVPTTSSYYPNVCMVTVNVAWTNRLSGKPVPHLRQMQTHVARYGLQNYIWGAIQ